jgi:hypothetical protein
MSKAHHLIDDTRARQCGCGLSDVIGYEHPELVHRLTSKLGINLEQATELFHDVKLYLYLCASKRRRLAPPPIIDAAWHEFLMYTRDYWEFCYSRFGEFVHHTPQPKLRPYLVADPRTTTELARTVFGSLSQNWDLKPACRENTEAHDCESECTPDHDCHGDGSCGGDV